MHSERHSTAGHTVTRNLIYSVLIDWYIHTGQNSVTVIVLRFLWLLIEVALNRVRHIGKWHNALSTPQKGWMLDFNRVAKCIHKALKIVFRDYLFLDMKDIFCIATLIRTNTKHCHKYVKFEWYSDVSTIILC